MKNIVCGNVYRHPHNNCEKNIVCGNVYRHPHNNCEQEYCMW